MATKTFGKDGNLEKTTDKAVLEKKGEEKKKKKAKKAEVSLPTTYSEDSGEFDRNVGQTKEPRTSDQAIKGNDDDTLIPGSGNMFSIVGVPSLTTYSKNNGKKENVGQTNEPSTSDTGDQATKKDAAQIKLELGRIVYSAGVFLALSIAFILAVCFISPPEPEMKSDFDFVKVFGNGVDKLQQSFTNQTERFWKILKNRGLAHLRNKHPSQPLVFLLAAPPPAHEWVDCLATKLAEKLDPKQKRHLPKIDGNKEKSNPADKTKIKMDELLKEKFNAGHRVALIHHLELLPPPSPLLFYSYCDDQNAPHKHVAIIFTVHLPVEPSSSLPPKEAEGTVEKYLANEVWSRDDKDAVAALLSRIADTVVLMNGESGYSLKAFCS